ncbi:MAG TPA: DUF262 domain-containing protein [Bacteroidia bacterium]|jgi:hypothetical protein|nr:DUF262 domain-containing protein [Bacteroidia bacterium]
MLTIKRIIERVISGEIRIPAFQRDFVWSSNQVSFLLDSIYKNFPIGNVFLWKTSERLSTEKSLGNYTVPDPRKDHPIYYVLDGQQRITSLFSVFQTELTADNNYDWLDVYFDFTKADQIQEPCFISLKKENVVKAIHFPMNVIFRPLDFHKEVNNLDDKQKRLITDVYQRFLEFTLPAQEIETDDITSVAIIFERINRAGTPLDTYQLLTAWSWSSDFDLQEEFSELSSEMEPFGFGNISEEKDLQLKCCSGIITGEASPSSIINLKGESVRKNFEKIKNGLKGAVDFLRNELNVYSLEWMPYPSMLVSLSYFFATEKVSGKNITHKQREQLIKWFWRSSFARRYTGGISDKHKQDIASMKALSEDENTKIAEFECEISNDFFTNNQFNVSAVNTKTFVLFLAFQNPLSFLSGANVTLSDVLKLVNRNEFHHIFPKKHLQDLGVESKKINALVNFCFLSNGDNQKIKNKSPLTYKDLINPLAIENVLSRALCPSDSLDLSYDHFVNSRVELLAAKAKEII